MNSDVILSVVIVSYNTSDYLRRCLESIYKNTTGISYEVIVVDNSSSDGSVKMIRNSFPQTILYELKENLGFTKGNNVGIKAAKGKYVLILNPDTAIRDNAFPRIIEFLENNPEAVGATCRLIQDNGKWQESAFRYPSPFLKWLFFSTAMLLPLPPLDRLPCHKSDKLIEADWISGAAMMLRTEPLKKIGGFDERIFMFNEDVDLCIRLKKSTNSKIYYFPDTTIIHIGQVSHGGKIFPMRCGFRSTCYYINKYFGIKKARVFILATRLSWALTLLPLILANLVTMFSIHKLRIKTRIYFQLLTTKADCLSGTT